MPSNIMQILQSKYKIENTEKDTLLSILSDKYCRTIITATMGKPKSAIELAAETKIPISTIYRRLQTLYDNKLLRTSGMISSEGKKFFLYKSKIRGINSSFENGQVEIKLLFNQ
jgi:predicted transcriptional regulator